jgi:LacI family transcriptional regulator
VTMKSVTIHDVARLAEVSPATVSRVLNGTRVDPALEARVRDAVVTLGYHPSGVARSLRRRSTRVWGLVISEVRNPFFTEMIRSVEEVAQAAGYFVVVCNSDHSIDKERRYFELIAGERMAGAIVTPASSIVTDLAPLRRQGVPVVVVDRQLDGDQRVDSVVLDNRRGSFDAVSHLIASGYQRIACIAGPQDTTTGAQRLAGYVVAIETAGRRVQDELVRATDFREAGGHQATLDLLALPDPPDGLFVCNNLMTLGALEALSERGVRVPDRLGIVGFDDMPWAPLVQPPLSAVAQPVYAVGRTAATLLLRRIAGEDSEPQTVLLQPTLHVRGSSSRPGAGARSRGASPELPDAGRSRPSRAARS